MRKNVENITYNSNKANAEELYYNTIELIHDAADNSIGRKTKVMKKNYKNTDKDRQIRELKSFRNRLMRFRLMKRAKEVIKSIKFLRDTISREDTENFKLI